MSSLPFTERTATELSNFLECSHRAGLDMLVRERKLERPGQSDLERKLLALRGTEHELAVRAHYEERGLTVVDIDAAPGAEARERAIAATLAAMESGADVIYQAALEDGDWLGRPDFLVRRDGAAPGRFRHHYEVVDAKLAREAKAAAVLQLCSYTEHLEEIQGVAPKSFYIAPGGGDAAPLELRVADYAAYYRTVRARFEAFVKGEAPEPYPEPVEHCAVCPWWKRCEERRRADDHLSLVAGITRRQRERLGEANVTRVTELAALREEARVAGVESLPRLREQASLQVQQRADEKPRFRLLLDGDRKPERLPEGAKPPLVGLEALPKPTPGDLFLDLEGDAFFGGEGLEYLFGILELGQPEFDFTGRDAPGAPNYKGFWATTPAEEKRAFEAIMDRIRLGRNEFARMHVFHFGHRESDALKKLSCRHKTREEEVDQLLREHALVDLYPIVRHALIASVEGYTLKQLEALHTFSRTTDLREAGRAMQLFGWWLETRDAALAVDATRTSIEAYNRDDCLSTWKLRDFLEARRADFEKLAGRPAARPDWDEVSDKTERVNKNAESAELARKLVASAREGGEPNARLLMANLLDWHWRESKSGWWEYYRALELAPDDRLADRAALAELTYEGEVGKLKQSLVHRYSFPEQEHAVRSLPPPIDPATTKSAGEVVRIGENFIELKRGTRSIVPHPLALIPGKPIETSGHEQSLRDLGESIAKSANDERVNPAAWQLLRRAPPSLGQGDDEPLLRDGESVEQGLARLALSATGSVLAIQGPPGSGKTHQAAEMILGLLRAGKRVGVTANSHAVCRELLKKVVELDRTVARAVHVQDDDETGDAPPPFELDNDKPRVRQRLQDRDVNLVGGTTWTWVSRAFAKSVDVLVIDEAGQVSLANVLAVARAATTLVLVGDPAQLEQPQKGVHPPGADVSALQHLLGDELTIPRQLGVFLPDTRRLHPSICKFISETFYEGRLSPLPELTAQSIRGPSPFDGAGLRYVPAKHNGNTNQSSEEVDVVVEMFRSLDLLERNVSSRASFVRGEGNERKETPLTQKDVLVVAPYNAQVSALRRALPADVQVGTVDRFQGKQAPIVVYSMATSTAEDAPRGLDFLYSRNRLNVAISRAQALAVLVASPALTQVACKSPRQMRLVNALCQYVELARAPSDGR